MMNKIKLYPDSCSECYSITMLHTIIKLAIFIFIVMVTMFAVGTLSDKTCDAYVYKNCVDFYWSSIAWCLGGTAFIYIFLFFAGSMLMWSPLSIVGHYCEYHKNVQN